MPTVTASSDGPRLGGRTSPTSAGSGASSSNARWWILAPWFAEPALQLVTRDGTTVTGRLLNHDTLAVLLIDYQEQLRSFEKPAAQLRSC